MDRVQEILQQFIGKSISNIYEVVTDYSLVYRIDFSDGVSLEFHGGSIGYENADPWYEICENESNTSFSGCGARKSLIEDKALKLARYEIHATAPQSAGNDVSKNSLAFTTILWSEFQYNFCFSSTILLFSLSRFVFFTNFISYQFALLFVARTLFFMVFEMG